MKKRRGLACVSKRRRRQIAAMGGKAAPGFRDRALRERAIRTRIENLRKTS